MTAFDAQPPGEPDRDPSLSAADRRDAAVDPGDDAAVPTGPYIARAASYYRNVRFLIVAAMIGMGAWFLYDGFVAWPAEQKRYYALQDQIDEAERRGDLSEATRLRKEQEGVEPHDGFDIPTQKIFGFSLPPLALLLLARWLYISRGEVRLTNDDVLHAPGHPPLSPADIEEIDDASWDRKGISTIYYDDRAGNVGRVKLDDFIYDRKPIDAIHDRLLYLKTGEVRDSLHDSHDAATDAPEGQLNA